jgi:26S proteasome regulatory subunit N9
MLLLADNDEEARKKLDECDKILESFDAVETVVHAAFYKANSEYYKVKAASLNDRSGTTLTDAQSTNEFASYYKNALLYLACVSIDDLTLDERRSRAHDLSLAALVSDTIYNFGELLLHPILDSLIDTPNAWLRHLLFAFNRGDLKEFDKLSGHIAGNPLLKAHKGFLYQKISLAALTETAFRRPPHDRALTFTTISKETQVKPEEIEHLIMKALSLGLLKGTIDQVSEVARINWVQPKVLDMKQIESMRLRLKEWDSSVNQLGTWIEGVGKDVWAA